MGGVGGEGKGRGREDDGLSGCVRTEVKREDMVSDVWEEDVLEVDMVGVEVELNEGEWNGLLI